FRLDLLRDIRVRAKPADDVAGLVANGQSAREEPAIAAVTAAQRECVLPGRTVLEALPDTPDDALDMIGMVNFLPAPSLHFLERRPRVVMPTFVLPVDPARRISGPCKLTDVVGEFLEASFAFAQGIFTGTRPSRLPLVMPERRCVFRRRRRAP